MPERKRIVRFEIVLSCIPFLLRLSQIVEPESEPHPRPPRIRLKINHGFRMFYRSSVPHTNPDLQHLYKPPEFFHSVLCTFVHACIFKYLAEDFPDFLLQNMFDIVCIDIRICWKEFVNPVCMLCDLVIAADIFTLQNVLL